MNRLPHKLMMLAVLALAATSTINQAHAASDNHLIYNTAGQLDIILKPNTPCPSAGGWYAAEIRNRVTGANRGACFQEGATSYFLVIEDTKSYSIFPKYRFTVLRNISY